ncbi:condensin complex subunit 1 isoform X1 [Selaginella moellendorffii]|uniref:condensin complex subunit 1 isoform X1 n=1 Tax=Selaginella moellendorffii TaxID=88036 RepID=UPI000D1CCAEC|nr:condensin complex subunit 1 isoform X1 [Selaginella moellendorffii]|eukprot:XP_024543850.1 condensin complex subunit 1 isoform X1 [Selaginella moellendorffii]
MAPCFVIPQSGGLEELEKDCGEEDFLVVQRDFSTADGEELAKGEILVCPSLGYLDHGCLVEVAFQLGDNEVTCIEEQAIFDQLFAIVKNFPSLQPSTKRLIIESLCSNFTLLIASIASLKREDAESDPAFLCQQIHSQQNALKLYSFFLQQIYTLEEAPCSDSQKTKASTKSKQPRKKNPTLSWKWEDFRARIVSSVTRVLEADLQLLYGMARPENGLLNFLAKFGLKLLENPTVMKDKEAKDEVCKFLATCAVKYDYHEQLLPSLIDLLHKCEHVPIPLADLVTVSDKSYGDNTLAVGILREVGMTGQAEYNRLPTVADNVKLFLVELADRLPKVLAANLSVLMPHFGGESYKIRNALVTVLGRLVVKAFGDNDSNLSEDIRLRNKQAMLDVLIERTRDTNAFTRACVLQTWGYLCEQNSLSISLWNQVVDIAAGRLHDKAVLVRKNALQLLTTLLEYNPFGPMLKTGRFEATLEIYKLQLEKMTQGNGTSGETETETETARFKPQEEAVNDNETQDSAIFESQGPPETQKRCDIGSLEQTRALVASLESALHFSRTMASTIPVISQLFSSSAIFDVQQSIQFLTKCHKFSIDGAEECMRKMLPLVFSQERSIYEAVEGAFVVTYIKKSPQETASNLLQLVLEAPVGHLTSIEALLISLVKKREIPAGTEPALWDIFTFNSVGVTPEQCRCALSLLCMIAKASPKVFSSRIQNVVDIGFGRWAKQESLLARFACLALQRLTIEDKQQLQPGHKVFSILASLISDQLLPDEIWYSAAEQAISAIYVIHPVPEAFMSALMLKFLDAALQKTDEGLDSSILSRFLFATGHVALKHLVYIETCVRAIRKQKCDREREAAAVDANAAEDGVSSSKDEGINAELGVAAAEDVKLDYLLEKAEREIVSGSETRKLLIGSISPLVSKLCKNSTVLQKFPQLRSSVVLCLCKLMAVDSNYCDANLQLLFTLAQNSPEDAIRSNCIISLGDIAFRFPNLLEPWTENIYARLHDRSDYVRKNAVLVISHLVLNDMMKVKGHISEMAIRTQDENSRISELAKLFFSELSKRGTSPIYNFLPDILSRLSSSTNISGDTFRNIMQFLLDFIKKDRQIEGLIEKLCNRFVGTSDRAQWQAIAYCLSQLTFTDKAMKRLIDLFKQFANALVDEQVLDSFKTICSKAKKLAKQDYRQLLEEFELKITACHEQKREEEVAAMEAQHVADNGIRCESNGASKNDEEQASSTVSSNGSTSGEDEEVCPRTPVASSVKPGSVDGDDYSSGSEHRSHVSTNSRESSGGSMNGDDSSTKCKHRSRVSTRSKVTGRKGSIDSNAMLENSERSPASIDSYAKRENSESLDGGHTDEEEESTCTDGGTVSDSEEE